MTYKEKQDIEKITGNITQYMDDCEMNGDTINSHIVNDYIQDIKDVIKKYDNPLCVPKTRPVNNDILC